MTARLAPGTEIDGFRIVECVRDGGMGFIYRVSGPDTGFPLMMKVPRLGQGQPTEGIVSFEIESMLLAAIDSRHAPRFVAAGDLAVMPYLVIEWIEGENLESIVRRAPRPADEVARIGAALADAAESLHRQDVIHLDIKPGNVLLRPDGQAVLVDFGLSHHARLPDLMAEEMRKAVGTAEYISPEQVLDVRNDPRSDVFAIGVVLYELATGELPFGSPRSVSGLRDRLWLDPRPPRAISPQVPPWLQEVILRCIEPRPDRRYPSAAQLGFALRHPDRVELTARADKLTRLGVFGHLRRWFHAAGREAEILPAPSEQVAAVPIVVAAVDTAHIDDELQRALQSAVGRVLVHAPGARLACVSVLRGTPVFDGAKPGESASTMHLDHLVRLRQWAQPMKLPTDRLSLHVLEGSDVARVIVEYALANHASLIVMGAAHYSERMIGRSTTTEVAEEAHCSVYVVRSSRPVLGEADVGRRAPVESGVQETAAPIRQFDPR